MMIMTVKEHIPDAGLVTAQKVSATMQEGGKSVDAAHADAMNMRNRQYQKLHRDYQNLSADYAAKRQLASRQDSQISQLQVCTVYCIHRMPATRALSPAALLQELNMHKT